MNIVPPKNPLSKSKLQRSVRFSALPCLLARGEVKWGHFAISVNLAH